LAISTTTRGRAIGARLPFAFALLSRSSGFSRPYEDSSELIGLSSKRLRVSDGAYLGFLEDLEPQGGLVDFLDCATELVDEVGARLGATDGPIVRGSRRRSIGELGSDFVVDVVLRNRREIPPNR